MMMPWTRRRKERLEREWAAEVAAYRDAGGRSTSRPDLPNPFLIMGDARRDPQGTQWRREFMAQFDSRTGQYDDNPPYPPSPRPARSRGSRPSIPANPLPPPAGSR